MRTSYRARRLVRLLRILAAVIRDPGVRPAQLATRAGTSERTLYRDLARLRRLGYAIVHSRGYRMQESLWLLDGSGPQGLASAYQEELRLLRQEAPDLAEQVEAEVDAEAPATLASLFAAAIERHLPQPPLRKSWKIDPPQPRPSPSEGEGVART